MKIVKRIRFQLRNFSFLFSFAFSLTLGIFYNKQKNQIIMHPMLKNILAVFVGLILGGGLNIGIITIGGQLIAPPAGVDPSDIESIKANIHLYEFHDFIVPFLAHALGTLLGAFIAYKFAATNKMRLALTIGAFFLLGGIQMVKLVGGPLWFIILDLLGAYFPMAWLGAKLAGARTLSD